MAGGEQREADSYTIFGLASGSPRTLQDGGEDKNQPEDKEERRSVPQTCREDYRQGEDGGATR